MFYIFGDVYPLLVKIICGTLSFFNNATSHSPHISKIHMHTCTGGAIEGQSVFSAASGCKTIRRQKAGVQYSPFGYCLAHLLRPFLCSLSLPGHQEKLDWKQSLPPFCSISQPLLHACSSFLHHHPSQYDNMSPPPPLFSASLVRFSLPSPGPFFPPVFPPLSPGGLWQEA